MGLLFYRFSLRLYYIGIGIVSLWNPKAKFWIKGRKGFPGVDYTKAKECVVWMHCASLGEFEQGRPLLEAIRSNYPSCKLVISFFSASGYEMTKNYKGADHIFYLPKDSRVNAEKLISLVNPSLVLWIKYEYWFYYLHELRKKRIPALLISAVYFANMPFFKWYGSLWVKMLDCFTHFFVQNTPSAIILEKVVPVDKITNSGDTRFDRVLSIAQKFEPVPGIEEFCEGRQVVVAGSTWEDDEAEWIHYVKIHTDLRFIIAPHEIDKENLTNVRKKFPGSIFYSEWLNKDVPPKAASGKLKPNCLVIDNIGILSRLYRYATICYVGGGFGSNGLHNILEAAVFSKGVIFGPEFSKNFEAIELMEAGGAISITNALKLEKVLNQLLTDEIALKRMGQAAGNYVQCKAGATQKIMEFIKKNAFLPVDQTVLQTDQNPSSQF